MICGAQPYCWSLQRTILLQQLYELALLDQLSAFGNTRVSRVLFFKFNPHQDVSLLSYNWQRFQKANQIQPLWLKINMGKD